VTNFSIQPGQRLKQNHTWGIGRTIGDCQARIIRDRDYNYLEDIRAAIASAFGYDAATKDLP
jgi:hypothetical protein